MLLCCGSAGQPASHLFVHFKLYPFSLLHTRGDKSGHGGDVIQIKRREDSGGFGVEDSLGRIKYQVPDDEVQRQ